MARSKSTDYLQDVRRGIVRGHSIMEAMGEFVNGLVVAAGQDVCRSADVSGPGRLPTPSSLGEQFTIISDGAQDNASGTGVTMLRIHYIDTSGDQQTEDIAPTGLSGVDTVLTDAIFINDFHAVSVGSGGVAAGNISIYKKGGSIASNLYNLIALGGNKSLVPHRMVPAGHKLYLHGWTKTEAQGKRSIIRLRSTDMYGELLTGVFCFKGTAYLKQGQMSSELPRNEIPPLSIVKATHWDEQAGAEGSCEWWGVLIQDGY